MSLSDTEREIMLRDGRALRLRPIRPGDAEALVEMGRRSTPEDLRLRFLSTVRPRLGSVTTMLTQFDPARHLAVAAYAPERPEDGFMGVVRLVIAPTGDYGEYAIMVRSDCKGQGLGRALMGEMLGWARDRGLARVEGQVLPENAPMLRMVRACGGVILPSDGNYHTVRVEFDLRSTT